MKARGLIVDYYKSIKVSLYCSIATTINNKCIIIISSSSITIIGSRMTAVRLKCVYTQWMGKHFRSSYSKVLFN